LIRIWKYKSVRRWQVLVFAIVMGLPGFATADHPSSHGAVASFRLAETETDLFDSMLEPLLEKEAQATVPAEVEAALENLQERPANAAGWEALGDAVLQSSDGDEAVQAAIAAYSAAALYDSNAVGAQRKLAYLLMSQGRFGPALAVFEEFLPRTAADPDWLDLSSACVLYARLGRMERGSAFLEHMLLLVPHDRTLLAMGVMETVRGRADSGRALFDLVADNADAAPLLAALAATLSAPGGTSE
jgi:cytochrome c-type biogenesis protein CcmH/NrfG